MQYEIGDELDQEQLDAMDKQWWTYGTADVYLTEDTGYFVKDNRIVFRYERKDE